MKGGNQLDNLLIDYFQYMFSSNVQERPMEFLKLVRVQVIAPMNEALSHKFLKEKIVAALH